MKTTEVSVYDKLSTLGIAMPPAGAAGGAYVMVAQTGNILFLSGHIAKRNGAVWAGKLGKDLTTDDGIAAARLVAIDLMATLHAYTGDLNKIKRIVKVMSLVNSTPEFVEQHLVTNGASELFLQVFGESGRHARSAFGVAQIPFGGCVEIELIVELTDHSS
jgi:enamine deaminase RidA (YjgF/YER057c/UK114 family)